MPYKKQALYLIEMKVPFFSFSSTDEKKKLDLPCSAFIKSYCYCATHNSHDDVKALTFGCWVSSS